MTDAGRPAVTEIAVARGDVIAGKYEVERVLGNGGFGVVVAAMHRDLGERVAIKLLHPRVAERGETVERFLREARAAVRIRSEHVARVIDVGRLESGAPYMVMEHLVGQDLSHALEAEGPMSPEHAVAHVLQACEAVAEAHALGIVHRDLKPANLFLTARADGTPLVKVLDFGISKTLDEGATPLTTTHGAMGSPMYMSPEQIRSAKHVDARTDIWSLGVILYELLADATPFEADTTSAMLAAIVADPPIPLRSRRPDMPAALEQVIARCLEKDPTRRFASLAELSAAIAPFAPEQARVSVPRIARVLGAAGPPQPEAAPPRSLASTMGETRGRPPETADTAPAVSSPTTAKQDGAPPDAWVPSYNGTPAGTQAPARSARAVLIAGAAIGLVGLAATTLVVGRTRATDPPGASSPASGAPTAAPSEPARPSLTASSSPAAPSASTAPAASTTTTADGRAPSPVGAERAPSRGKTPPATPSVSAPSAAPPSPASPTQAPTRPAVPEERTW